MVFGSTTGEVRSTVMTVDRAVVYSSYRGRPFTTQTSCINEFCLSQPGWTTTPKRTEQNLIVRSGKSEAKVTSNRRLRLRSVRLSNRHETSRGLSATAGLLVELTVGTLQTDGQTEYNA